MLLINYYFYTSQLAPSLAAWADEQQQQHSGQSEVGSCQERCGQWQNAQSGSKTIAKVVNVLPLAASPQGVHKNRSVRVKRLKFAVLKSYALCGHSRQWFVGAKTYASENITLPPVKCKPVTFATLVAWQFVTVHRNFTNLLHHLKTRYIAECADH